MKKEGGFSPKKESCPRGFPREVLAVLKPIRSPKEEEGEPVTINRVNRA